MTEYKDFQGSSLVINGYDCNPRGSPFKSNLLSYFLITVVFKGLTSIYFIIAGAYRYK
jgi:hypothetical protein